MAEMAISAPFDPGSLVSTWIGRQDHLVALAIAKKRRDDLKRKADEVRQFFHELLGILD